MKCVYYKLFVFIAWAFFGALLRGESVDPRNPAEWTRQKEQASRELSLRAAVRIDELKAERAELLQAVRRFPRYSPLMTHGRIGYHSSFCCVSNAAASDRVISWNDHSPREVRAIALVPAYDPLGITRGAYGFPRRFKIEVRSAGSAQLETVVDWMDADFPDPGMYPVFFSDIDRDAVQVKLTVPVSSTGTENRFFALGELYIFGGNPGAHAMDNVIFWHGNTVSSSDDFKLKPSWDLFCLSDHINGLGLPVSSMRENKEDLLIVEDEKYRLKNHISVVLDLGHLVNVGRVDVWPAVIGGAHGLADFGFPQEIEIERSGSLDFGSALALKRSASSSCRPPGFIYSVRSWPPKVRYLRVKFNRLRMSGKNRTLGIGEIVVRDKRGRRLMYQIVKTEGIAVEYCDQLDRLNDGFSGGRRILSDADWIKGLAQRRPLDRRLREIEQEIEIAEKQWQLRQKEWVTAGIFGIGFLSIGMIVFQRHKRKQVLRSQGQRITRDLHDEVGSSLGGITLIAQHLAEKNKNEELDKMILNLGLMAREANASLREVIWGGSGKKIQLDTLLEHLADRAERVLSSAVVDVFLPDFCPSVEVSLSVKRHVILFFKEAVHNCAKHAGASMVCVSARIENDALILAVHDNGAGFDVARSLKGWGLETMRKRAQELGGNLKIMSCPGEGTSVELTLPIRNFSRHLNQEYKTSN